ncbi:MAG: hypothetical protein NZ992_07615 [Candidatus Korarchaeum sp.]|nr:hypothetical protein [Candidatus Korarchaeum sp.]MDW8035721.1 hypothetical protein [Candidatus Korarchaeum sp.]
MVQSAKVFISASSLHPRDLVKKLKGFSSLKKQEAFGRSVEVGSRVLDLDLQGDKLTGMFEENFLLSFRYMDELIKVPITVRTFFEFLSFEGDTYLVVAAKKSRANRIANQLSSAISNEKGLIQEAWITPEALKKFYESKIETVRVLFFSDVRIPNVSRLSLYGRELAGTNLYQEYVKLGRVWYAVFEPEDGVVIGLTRNCVVTFFSKLSLEEAIEFIEVRVLPMVRITRE